VITQSGLFARAAAFGLLIGSISLADAKTRADCEREYTPQPAQEGKDVIWAPTEDAMVAGMLEMAKVTAADKVYDLGAGDGKIVIAAAKQAGATGVGIEYDADLVAHARCLAEAEGVDGLVTFIQGDIFETDFSDATVVALYLLPELNLRLLPTFLAMQPGTRIVSYSFGIGDWEPDNRIDSYGQGSSFLWIVPANVEGGWTFRPVSSGTPFDVELEQMFQNLLGTADGMSITGKLTGDRIDFAFIHDSEQVRVTGTVTGDRIAATVVRSRTQLDYVGTRD
jgi:SAM-dependent methyltransferase